MSGTSPSSTVRGEVGPPPWCYEPDPHGRGRRRPAPEKPARHVRPEEDRSEQRRARPEPRWEPPGEEALHHEAARERVHREEPGEPQHHPRERWSPSIPGRRPAGASPVRRGGRCLRRRREAARSAARARPSAAYRAPPRGCSELETRRAGAPPAAKPAASAPVAVASDPARLLPGERRGFAAREGPIWATTPARWRGRGRLVPGRAHHAHGRGGEADPEAEVEANTAPASHHQGGAEREHPPAADPVRRGVTTSDRAVSPRRVSVRRSPRAPRRARRRKVEDEDDGERTVGEEAGRPGWRRGAERRRVGGLHGIGRVLRAAARKPSAPGLPGPRPGRSEAPRLLSSAPCAPCSLFLPSLPHSPPPPRGSRRHFSIVARDPARGELGVAVASRFFAVGRWSLGAGRGGCGRDPVLRQHDLRPAGLDLLEGGASPPRRSPSSPGGTPTARNARSASSPRRRGGHLHGQGVQPLGGRAERQGLRDPGEHPRRRGRGRRDGEGLPRDEGLARRSPSSRPRRRRRRWGRLAGAPVGGAPGREGEGRYGGFFRPRHPTCGWTTTPIRSGSSGASSTTRR